MEKALRVKDTIKREDVAKDGLNLTTLLRNSPGYG